MADSTTSYSVELSHVLQDLKEKFKHGEHITRILEGQLDTAQQNISLLQGQVRLANETIDNLKQQFKSSENAVYFLLENSERLAKDMTFKVNSNDRSDHCNHVNECNNQEEHVSSPKSVIILQKDGSQEYVMSSTGSSQHGNSDKPKSPYAQQLRQVLDILQNEEPSKKLSGLSNGAVQSPDDYSSSCHCPECNGVGPHGHVSKHSPGICKSLSCTCSYHVSNSSNQHEREKTKMIAPWCVSPKLSNGIEVVHSSSEIRLVSSVHKPSPGIQQVNESSPSPRVSLMNHNPCDCSTPVHHSKYKVIERGNPSTCHYGNTCSDGGVHRVEEQMQQCKVPCSTEECGDGCSCHSYGNYTVPYGYQVMDGGTGVPHTMHPLNSPGRKRKRFPGMLPVDDPPHLKYTKIKRIDGSKLTAQKTIADFSKRRYLPCNPRYDLDLLIVPPPLSAAELLSPSKDKQSDLLPRVQVQDDDGVTPGPQNSDETSQEHVTMTRQDTPQIKEVVSVSTISPASSTGQAADDTTLVYLENNNMHPSHDRTLHKPAISDLASSKLPHLLTSFPPSLSTKS